MKLSQQFAATDIEVSRRAYDDRSVLAADFGPAADPTVDVVGDTVIVVAEDEQYELDVSEYHDVDIAVHNGVMTIEVGA